MVLCCPQKHHLHPQLQRLSLSRQLRPLRSQQLTSLPLPLVSSCLYMLACSSWCNRLSC